MKLLSTKLHTIRDGCLTVVVPFRICGVTLLPHAQPQTPEVAAA